MFQEQEFYNLKIFHLLELKYYIQSIVKIKHLKN